MVTRTFTKEQTMSNAKAEPKPCELTEEELDRVSGGGSRPKESLSLNFTKIQFTNTSTNP